MGNVLTGSPRNFLIEDDMNPAEFLIVDGTALLFKMYFAPGSHRSQSGIEVGGVVGVARGLVNLVREHSPSYVAVVFDEPLPHATMVE